MATTILQPRALLVRTGRTSRRLAGVAAVALAAGLVATGSAPRAAGPVIALSYNADLATLGFPNPVLRATVNGQAVWFLIDTGASVHTLAKWFTTAARISTHESKTTLVGSTGASSAARSTGPVPLVTRDGGTLTLRETVVVDFPAVFADQRIAGLISPQLLPSVGQATILNLQAPSLAFAPFDSAVATLGVTPSVAAAGTHVCPTQGQPAGRSYAATVTVAGIPADMTLDTGATATLVASSRVSRALAARAVQNGQVQGVGADPQAAKTVAGVTVVRAGVGRKVDLMLGGSSQGCGVDGLLGMDSLRGCTVVLGDTAMAWSCGGS